MKLATAYLLFLLLLLCYGHYNKQSNIRNVPEEKVSRVYAQEKEKKVDERYANLKIFFKRYNTPLEDHIQDFIEASDKYNLDYRLLPAISGVESTFETRGNISDHNPFGYMCKNKPCYFKSYREAIFKVAKTIGEKSVYKGYRQSHEIYDLARPYNYVSPEDWTSKINFFINKLDVVSEER